MSNNTFFIDYPKLLSLAAAGLLIPGRNYSVRTNDGDPGLQIRALTTTLWTATNGNANTKSGYSGLIIGASGDGRCYSVMNLQNNTIAITSGVITFRIISPYPMRKGHRIRVGSNNFPQIECMATVISTVAESGGTRVNATINPLTPLADLTAGTVTGTDHTMGDMQCWSSAASYTSAMGILSGGRLKLTMFGTSGSIIQDWLAPLRVAQVRAMGRMPFLIIGIGISGNALNANGQSGDMAADAMENLIQLHSGQFDKIYVGDVSVLSDEFGSGSGAGGVNTATYAAGQRYLNRMDELTTKYPHVTRVPINSYEAITDYAADTQAGTNGFCQVTDKQDDGVHPVWGAAWAEGEAYWQVIKQDFPFRPSGARVKPFSVLRSTTADSGGKFVQNLAEGLFGTVAATGNIPNHSSGVVTGPNGMSVTNLLRPSVNGGQEWITTVASGGNVAISSTAFSQIYSGTAGSLLTQLNLSANRGVPIEVVWDGGIYGFNELAMGYIELCLEVDTGDGLGFLEIAAGFCNNGLYNAVGSTYTTGTYAGKHGAQEAGFWGMVPFPAFTIDPSLPAFTGVRVRQTAKILTGADPGTFFLRQGPASIIRPAR